MSRNRVQILLFVIGVTILSSALTGEPVFGQIYAFTMTDVDGRTFSTADGRITSLVFTSSNEIAKARKVGDRTPEHCLGNPEFRMVTVLRFEQPHSGPAQAITKALVRQRLAGEARALQIRYKAKNVTHDARQDVICVTDFDGKVGSQLGLADRATSFEVLVLGRKGELLRRWTDVPTKEELAEVLK